jgi:hypothetical protein
MNVQPSGKLDLDFRGGQSCNASATAWRHETKRTASLRWFKARECACNWMIVTTPESADLRSVIAAAGDCLPTLTRISHRHWVVKLRA